MARNFAEYAARNEILRTLGFRSYSDYLKSDLWASIRLRVLDKHEHLCTGCRRMATQVHHKKYTTENLAGKSIGCMTALCAGCHRKAEFSAKSGKVDLKKANQRLKTITRVKAQNYCWSNVPEYKELWKQLKDTDKPGTPFRREKMLEIRKKMRKLVAIAKTRTAGSESPAHSPQ